MIIATLTQLFLAFSGLFLIFVILLQRGRGGGLTGALGGMGGQSAFGTKAGDVFTKITVGFAVLWVVLNCASIFANRAAHDDAYGGRGGDAEITSTDEEGEGDNEGTEASTDLEGMSTPEDAPDSTGNETPESTETPESETSEAETTVPSSDDAPAKEPASDKPEETPETSE